ncbi:hypothetical protein B0T20DRAFT_505078 [Sordaria brevicollis]|uniref:Uncharacterized protein n=1 Tax=Sordaria brevicollis TaxID=83679 RepID=A0AAE0PIX0_SORBR|nr:hypothetical protein B0T20DRAFT_505078 [Sordaria brevicollis]
MPPERTAKRKKTTGPISKASPNSRKQNAKISERPVKKPPTEEASAATVTPTPAQTPKAVPNVPLAPKSNKSAAASASKSAKTPSSTQAKKQVTSTQAQKTIPRHAPPKRTHASEEPSSHAEPPSSSASTIEHSPPKVNIPHYKSTGENASSPRNNVAGRRELPARKSKQNAQKQIKALGVEISNAKSEEAGRGNKWSIHTNAKPVYMPPKPKDPVPKDPLPVGPSWAQNTQTGAPRQTDSTVRSSRGNLDDDFEGSGEDDETGGRKQHVRQPTKKGHGLKRTMKEGSGEKEVEGRKSRRKRQKETETKEEKAVEEEQPEGEELEDRTVEYDDLSRESYAENDPDGDSRMDDMGEENEETQQNGQEDVDEEVDDQNMDDAVDDQDDDQGMGTITPRTDHDGDTLMEEEEDGTEAGQKEFDDDMEDFELGDGSVLLDREGNATVYRRRERYGTIDGSVQKKMEVEDGLDREDDQGGETDMIPESELGDEASNGEQSRVDRGGNDDGNRVMSPGGVTDEGEEGEDGEEDEYKPDSSELEEGAEEEEKVQEEENQENEEEMEEYVEGAAEDPADVDAGADAQTEEAEDGEEGNDDPGESHNETRNTEIYKQLKDLIQGIPSTHFVYCRKLNLPNDIQDLAFKVVDVDNHVLDFDTRSLTEANIDRLLGAARRIYEKDHGWEFVNLPHDPNWMILPRTQHPLPTQPKSKTKGKEKKPTPRPTYTGNLVVVGGGANGGPWGDYVLRLTDEAMGVLDLDLTDVEVAFRPELEHLFIWGEKTLFRDHDFISTNKYHIGRLMVILAGIDYSGGEFAFGCENRCHYFDPQNSPCMIATLSDGTAYLDPLPLTSGYRLGLVYKICVPTAKMAEAAKRNTAANAVGILNSHEGKFLDGCEEWRKRVQESRCKPNGIQKTLHYILKKKVPGPDEFDPLTDLAPGQKVQLAWLDKIRRQVSEGTKRIGDKVYNWQLHLDLVVLSIKTFTREEGTAPGFETKWTAPADIERGDWDRNEAEEGMEVDEEAVINFGDLGFGSTGSDEYLCLRLLVDYDG